MSRSEGRAAARGTAPPTLQAAFRACDEETLVSEAICACALPVVVGQGGSAAHARSLVPPQRLRAALRMMCALTVPENFRSGTVPGAVAPLERFEAAPHVGLIERSIGCAAFTGPPACPCALERLAWEEALAFRVILAGEWCAKERYLMLADALWRLAGSPSPPRGSSARPVAAAVDYEETYAQRLAQCAERLNAAAYRACCDRVRAALSSHETGGGLGPPPVQRIVWGMSGGRCA